MFLNVPIKKHIIAVIFIDIFLEYVNEPIKKHINATIFIDIFLEYVNGTLRNILMRPFL